MIRVLATSLSGSEHILTGRVQNKEVVSWGNEAEARAHLTRIGWTNQRFIIDRTITDNIVRTTWDNQSVTLNVEGENAFTYERGGPASGKKLSKSDMNKGEK